MDKQKNEKVLAIFQAVWNLIDEGYTFSKMKVVDITNRAGIGKGTAYEYFRSKEEIIAEALKYDYLLQYQNLKEQLEKQTDFRCALEICFNWMSENVDRKRFSAQFFKKLSYNEKTDKSESYENIEPYINILDLMKMIVSLGKSNGCIAADISEEMAMIQIFSQIFGFFLYQEQNVKREKQDLEVMKRFLCDSIEKSLR